MSKTSLTITLAFLLTSIGSSATAEPNATARLSAAAPTNNGEAWVPKPSACALTGEFQQSRKLAGLPTTLESNGVFLHDCTKGLIWKTTEPVTEALIIDREQNGYIASKTSLAPMTSRAGKMIAQTMDAMLKADETTLAELFSHEPATNSEGASELVLIPVQTRIKQALQSIRLTLDENKQVSRVRFLDRRGDQTTIILSSIRVLGDTSSPQDCVEQNSLTALDCSPLYDIAKSARGADQ